MDFNTILGKLDSSNLTRESVALKKHDGFGVSWTNRTDETLSATVNGDDYDDLLKVCLVNDGDNVDVYINNVTRFKLTKFDLESVSTFSIS